MSYVIVIDDKAWPLSTLARKSTIIYDDILLRWLPHQNSVLDNFAISRGRDIGNVIAMRKK